jgi:hypothetical protein
VGIVNYLWLNSGCLHTSWEVDVSRVPCHPQAPPLLFPAAHVNLQALNSVLFLPHLLPCLFRNASHLLPPSPAEQRKLRGHRP